MTDTPSPLDRRTLLAGGTAALALAGLACLPHSASAQEAGRGGPSPSGKPAKPPLPPEAVQEFVQAAHYDFERVKQLAEQYPTIVNAAWDYGAGDWTTALGAAACMGKRDIAEFLLERGARMDVFAAAMLGKRALVEAFLADDPRVVLTTGPHLLPLEYHAEKGGHAELAAMIAERKRQLSDS